MIFGLQQAEQFAAVWPEKRLETMREAVARKNEIDALAKVRVVSLIEIHIQSRPAPSMTAAEGMKICFLDGFGRGPEGLFL